MTDKITKISEHIAKRFHVPRDRADRLGLKAATAMEAHGISLVDWDAITKTIEVVVNAWIGDGVAKT